MSRKMLRSSYKYTRHNGVIGKNFESVTDTTTKQESEARGILRQSEKAVVETENRLQTTTSSNQAVADVVNNSV